MRFGQRAGNGTRPRPAGEIVDDDHTSLAGQAIAGVSMKIDDRWGALADYRHVWSDGHSTMTFGGVAVDSTYRSQSVDIGLKRRF